ncbi:MAG: hypothetical protein AAF211_04195 [Myxococcota bacterium]
MVRSCILVGFSVMATGCATKDATGQFVPITEWVDSAILQGCDLAYQVREVPWEGPDTVARAQLEGLGDTFEVRADWTGTVPEDIDDDEVLLRISGLRTVEVELRPHPTLRPVEAVADPATGCPDLLTVPVAATVRGGTNLTLVDDGEQDGESWKGRSWAPWFGLDAPVVVFGDLEPALRLFVTAEQAPATQGSFFERPFETYDCDPLGARFLVEGTPAVGRVALERQFSCPREEGDPALRRTQGMVGSFRARDDRGGSCPDAEPLILGDPRRDRLEAWADRGPFDVAIDLEWVDGRPWAEFDAMEVVVGPSAMGPVLHYEAGEDCAPVVMAAYAVTTRFGTIGAEGTAILTDRDGVLAWSFAAELTTLLLPDASFSRVVELSEAASRPFWSPDRVQIGILVQGAVDEATAEVRFTGGPEAPLAIVGEGTARPHGFAP